MKTKVCAAALALVAAAAGFALDQHNVVFAEGDPVRRSSGVEEGISIGDVLQAGDTVVTGAVDSVELEAGTYKVRIAENTVFMLMEIEEGGQTQPVLSTALGKLSFARQRFGGSEPRLAGSAAICGVRGTEVTVLSGADGSTLIIVDEGAVEVSAAGARVALAKGEAVEVATGAEPGQKFQALSREIDFSKWNGPKIEAMLKDPVAAAGRVEKQLDGYIEQIRILKPLFEKRYADLKAARTRFAELNRTDQQAGRDFRDKTLIPTEREANALYVNLRFYCLSSLSLRRFVEGRLYALAKAQYIATPTNAIYQDFLRAHSRLLAKFESEVVGAALVEADI